MMITSRLRHLAGTVRDELQLPHAARAARERDRRGLPAHDPGITQTVDAGLAWLAFAQDRSISRDGGVARHFSIIDGWSASYPETTGYIVPTVLEAARTRQDAALRQRAIRMLDWLTHIQFPDGGFQGGPIGVPNPVPVVFNTGQILLGLAAGARDVSDLYLDPMRRAANWLVRVQDPDGAWRRFTTPFASPGEKTYATHVAWGLLEAHRVDPASGYADAALANIDWALRQQRANGWFERCCLTDHAQPLTHTIGYAVRGILEGFRHSRDSRLLDAARRAADGVLSAMSPRGFLPGRLNANWRGCVSWACLTGSVQMAHCWLLLFLETDDARYRDAAYAANAYVRRSIVTNGADPNIRGGVKGSFPVDGGYGTFQYLNWACKFSIDANLLEASVRGG